MFVHKLVWNLKAIPKIKLTMFIKYGPKSSYISFPFLQVYVFPSLPFITYGGTAILTAFLILALPETLNKKLPDTIEEAIEL